MAPAGGKGRLGELHDVAVGAGTELDQNRRPSGIDAEFRCGLVPAEQLVRIEQADRVDPDRAVAVQRRDAGIARIGDIRRFDNQIEETLALDERLVRLFRPPHAAPDPHQEHVGARRDRIKKAEIRIGSVENDTGDAIVINQLRQLSTQPPVPVLDIAFGINVERQIFCMESELLNHAERLAHGCENRIDADRQTACDREQPRQMAEPDAVGRQE